MAHAVPAINSQMALFVGAPLKVLESSDETDCAR